MKDESKDASTLILDTSCIQLTISLNDHKNKPLFLSF